MDFCCREVIRNCLQQSFPKTAKCLHQSGPVKKKAIPILAECGGFMYLHQEMQDMEGKTYPMAGVINAAAYRTEKLGRFGYITLDLNEEQAEARNIWQQSFPVRAHEFHYFDSTIREVPVWQKNRPGKEAGAAVMQKMAV